MPCHDLVAWVQCILPYAFSNVCQVQRAYAMRNQRCLSAAQSNLAADDGRAHIVEVCSAACRAGLQGLTWREVPALAPQPGRPPLLDAAALIKFSYKNCLEVRPPCSHVRRLQVYAGVCLRLVLEWQALLHARLRCLPVLVERCRQSAQRHAQATLCMLRARH